MDSTISETQSATISDLQLATALNVNKSTVWRWRTKLGMPNTSLEAARDWASNRVATKNKQDLVDVPDVIPVTGDCPYDVLARIRCNEQIIAGEVKALTLALNRARSARNKTLDENESKLQEKKIFSYTQMLKTVRKEHRESTRSLFAAESAVISLEEQRGKLISFEASQDFVTGRLMPVINWIRKLPEYAESPQEYAKLSELSEKGLAVIRGETV